MALASASNFSIAEKDRNEKFIVPFILVTSLFFLWGLAYGLLDVLNKHFQEALNITKQRSTLLQTAYFGAYFLMAVPAGMFMQKWGYKKGILTGLILYATGAFLFYPAASLANFTFFLIALFILATGLTFLETAANPYVTVLGKPETAALRLNLSQSFNGIGSFLGPIIGAALFFSENVAEEKDLSSIQDVYFIIGGIVVVITVLFLKTSLPEIRTDGAFNTANNSKKLHHYPHFIWAVFTQFFYIAAQVGIAALFINYCSERASLTSEQGAYLLSAGLFLFTIGRFAGTALMKMIPSHHLLAIFAAANIVLCAVVVTMTGVIPVYALVATFFFNSIMFPTIFALGLKDIGRHTKKGSSFMIMSIVGGAVVPYAMGSFSSTATAYVIPLLCFLVVLAFATKGYKIKS